VNGLSLRKYYGAINALLRFGARVGWVPALLEIDHAFTAKAKGKSKAQSGRSALSLAQLQRLFHRGYFDDADGMVSVVNRWIPLIALYQGARMGEVAQLDVLDVRLDNESGGWVVNFTEDGSPRQAAEDGRLLAKGATPSRA
jgi:integrase